MRLYIGNIEGRHTLVKGGVKAWLAQNRVPALWSPTRGGWWVRNEHINDLYALAQAQGVKVHLSRGEA